MLIKNKLFFYSSKTLVKNIENILSLVLVLNLIIGSIGIDIYHHICGTTGVSNVSAFIERNYSEIDDHTCCNELPQIIELNCEESSCCNEVNASKHNKTINCNLTDSCCTNEYEQLKISIITINERNQQIQFIPNFKIDFDIQPILNFQSNYSEIKNLFFPPDIISAGLIATSFIHQSAKNSTSDTEIPLS